MSDHTCNAPACELPSKYRGLCTGHYQRLRRTGDLGEAPIRRRRKIGATPKEVVAMYTNERAPEDCWEWTGPMGHDGYGSVSIDGKQWKGHRLAYTVRVGDIPDGLLIRHRCDNRQCVNPSHLEPGTHADNSRDMVERDRSPRGDRHGMAKVSDAQVAEIREKYATGRFPQRQLAIEYGCSVPLISMIVNCKHRSVIAEHGAAV